MDENDLVEALEATHSFSASLVRRFSAFYAESPALARILEAVSQRKRTKLDLARWEDDGGQ